MKTLLKKLLQPILRLAMRILFRVEIRGIWPAPLPERLLIVANHESFIDGMLLGLFLPIKPVFIVHTWVAQNWLYGRILKLVDHLAVDPTCPMAIKQVIKLVESGRPVVIFPEGRITITGSLMKVYDGPAFIAAHTGAAVLPIRLDGPRLSYFSRMGSDHPRHFLPKLRLTIMPLEKIAIANKGSTHDRRRLAGESLRKVMQHMLFASCPIGTLYDALLDSIAVWGRKHRLIEDMRQVEHSYGELLKMTLALGRLVSRLAPVGSRIGVLMPNVTTTVGLILGITAVQRVPAMLNYTAGLSGIESACELGKVDVILTSRAFEEAGHLQEICAGLARSRKLIYLEDLRPTFTLRDKLWLLAALCFPRKMLPQGDPQSAAVTLFTSGSEGLPKGVVLTHQNLLANMAQLRSVIAFSAADKFLNALPLFHAYGLTAGCLLPLLTGTRLFLYPSPLHYRVIPEVVYDRDCTVMCGTSTFLHHYAKHAHPYDFYRLRVVIAGAERLASSVRETWFEKFGIRILEGYGATETSPVLSVNTPMAYKTGTVGQLLPGISHWLEPVPGIEEGGILHVKGPNIMQGYLLANQPGVLQATASQHGEGWYSTGDIVSIDSEGYVTIKGRLKRFAKIAGEMVSLEIVEKIAALADSQGQHAASNRQDESRGESIVLFTTNRNLKNEHLLEVARQRCLPMLAVPRDIRHLEEMPVLASGKIDYLALKLLADSAVASGENEEVSE